MRDDRPGQMGLVRRARSDVRAHTVWQPVDDPPVLFDLDFDSADQAGSFEDVLRTRGWAVPDNPDHAHPARPRHLAPLPPQGTRCRISTVVRVAQQGKYRSARIRRGYRSDTSRRFPTFEAGRG